MRSFASSDTTGSRSLPEHPARSLPAPRHVSPIRCSASRRAWVMAASFLVLAHALLWLADPHPFYMLGDSIGYLRTMLEPVPSLKSPLGYALMLFAPLLIVRELWMIVLVQVLSTLATGALAASIVGVATGGGQTDGESSAAHAGSTWSSRVRAGAPLVTFILVGLWPRHVYYAHTILSECLAVLWITCMSALLFGGRWRRWTPLAIGVTVAMSTITRSASIALWPAVLVLVLWPHAQRTFRRRIADLVLVACGAGCLLVPYAAMNRVVHGGFTITAFDGWTLFGTVGEHVDVSRIQDPETREIFEGYADALTSLSPSVLRWSALSPAVQLDLRNRADYENPRLREMISRDGLRQALARTWTHGENPEIRTNRELRRIAVGTIRDHPGAYVRGVLSRLTGYWLGHERYTKHFQALQGTENDRRVPILRNVLRDGFGTDLPATGSGLLLSARYAAYDARVLFLVPIVAWFGVTLRRRHRSHDVGRSILGLGAIATSVSLGTCAVAEIYDRYTVVTDGLVITAAIVAMVDIVVQRGPRPVLQPDRRGGGLEA